jgi:hypothetical protein
MAKVVPPVPVLKVPLIDIRPVLDAVKKFAVLCVFVAAKEPVVAAVVDVAPVTTAYISGLVPPTFAPYLVPAFDDEAAIITASNSYSVLCVRPVTERLGMSTSDVEVVVSSLPDTW